MLSQVCIVNLSPYSYLQNVAEKKNISGDIRSIFSSALLQTQKCLHQTEWPSWGQQQLLQTPREARDGVLGCILAMQLGCQPLQMQRHFKKLTKQKENMLGMMHVKGDMHFP